jgi:hypothetical protein
MQGLNRIKIPVLIILTYRFVKIGFGLEQNRVLPLITTVIMMAAITAAITAAILVAILVAILAAILVAILVAMTVDLILVLVMDLILVKEVVALMGKATAEATAMETLGTMELITPVKHTAGMVTGMAMDTAMVTANNTF